VSNLICSTPGVAARFDDLSRPVFAGERLSRGVAAHRDDPLRAKLMSSEHGVQSDRAVAHYGHGFARSGAGCDSTKPAGAEHIRRREQARDQVSVGRSRCRDERAVSERDAEQLGLRPQCAHRTRLMQALW